MYVKCGALGDARKVFECLPARNVVAWGAMIGGYAQHDHGHIVLELFARMQEEKTPMNTIILVSVLKACGSVGALILGRLAHAQVMEMTPSLDLVIGSTIVDMYSRCGSMDDAQNLFDKMPDKNVVTWGALVIGYARAGDCGMIEESLERMHLGGFEPDDLIFTGILTACCHAGLIEQGCWFFMFMVREYDIQPSMEQYCTMAHLLGGAGLLNEARFILQTMPSTPDTGIWMSLLTNCKAYGNTKLGGSCLDRAAQIHPSDASSYILLSNAYADAQMYACVDGHKARESEKGFAVSRTSSSKQGTRGNSRCTEISRFVDARGFTTRGNQTTKLTSTLCINKREFSSWSLVLPVFCDLYQHNVNQKLDLCNNTFVFPLFQRFSIAGIG
jgi:pentatricopeptide repeat protein